MQFISFEFYLCEKDVCHFLIIIIFFFLFRFLYSFSIAYLTWNCDCGRLDWLSMRRTEYENFM